MKLVNENLNSFVRNQDPKKSLGLGYEEKIRKFFRDIDIPDERYEIKEGKEIVCNSAISLRQSNILWIPDNLTINGWLDLSYSTIRELPNNLIIHKSLNLNMTQIIKLPDDLMVDRYISVDKTQRELINFIEHSKFKYQLEIW